MKKILLLCFTTLLSIPTWAYDFEATNNDGVTIFYNIVGEGLCEVAAGDVDYWWIDDFNIPSEVYNEDDDVAYTVVGIGDYAFYFCDLYTVTIPETVTYIGESAFEECYALEGVVIPESVNSIGPSAFNDCEEMAYANIPEGVSTLAGYVFYGCESLESIEIPESVTSIERGAFGFSGLTSIEIPGSVTSIGDGAFSYCTDLEEITLNEGLTYIDEMAFNNSSSLETITIPESVTYIGNNAFIRSGIKEAVVLAKVSTIMSSTFESCTSLSSIILSNTVGILKSNAFNSCSQLSSITCLNPEAVICDFEVFASTSVPQNGTLYVPKGSKELYASAETWEDFSEIVELDEEGIAPPTDENRFAVDGIYYNITDADALICEVTYASTSLNSYSGSVSIPETVDHNEHTYTVKGIGYSAFRASKGLTEVSVPEGITSIDDYAFFNCSSLSEISFPSSIGEIGDYSFYGCSTLKEITIPENITSLGELTFAECTSVKTLTMEDGDATLSMTTSSVTNPFTDCPIETLYLGRVLSYSGRSPFYLNNYLTSITFGEKVVSLSSSEFYRCEGLTEITIPGWVEDLGEYAFQECPNLRNVTLSEGIVNLGTRTFDSCPLTEVIIPSSVQDGRNPFYYCDGLKKATLRDGITSVVYGMFNYCTGLTDVYIPNSVTSIGQWAFAYCYALENLAIPDGVTKIDIAAFYLCSALSETTIPQTLEYIGDSSFYGCTNLKRPVLSDRVTTIDEDAFSRCSSAEETIIPISTSISYTAFSSCSSLERIYCLGSTPSSWKSSSAFNNVDKETCVLYVPVGAKEAYSSDSNWSTFTNIVELDDPYAITYSAGDLTSKSATLKGYIAIGSTEVTEVGFEYWSEGEDTKTTVIGNFSTSDEISCSISGLTYETEYTYRAYAKTASGTIYGDEVAFVSPLDATMVETYEATEVSETSAVLNGKVVVPYFDTIIEKGFVYWSEDPDIKTTISIDGDEMAYTVESLTPETTYTYHAYAINDKYVISYGEDVEFTTLEDSTTGIDNVEMSGINSDNVEGIYSIGGQKLSSTQKGVNIIRYNDGTTKKVLVK